MRKKTVAPKKENFSYFFGCQQPTRGKPQFDGSNASSQP
jgi:hypothetical protein